MGTAPGRDVIEFLGDVVAWFADPSNWTGRGGIPNRLLEHLNVSLFAAAVAIVLALPPALWLGHLRRGGLLAIAAVNVGRAIPSFGILAIAFTVLDIGIGYWPTFVALVLLAVPPIFTNAYTAVAEADRAVVEAARGMGMTARQLLWRIEVPIGAPVLLAGMRIAVVQVIATATLGAVIAFGGLGRYIIDGFAQRDNVKVFAGALLVAALTLLAEGAFTLVERFVLPRGIRRVRTEAVAETAHPT